MKATFLDGVPIVDAHHHFWDLSLNKHPWLCDPSQIPFRYGDYKAIRMDYLHSDYQADSAGINVVKTVYVETEWDPSDSVGETQWVETYARETGFPNAVVAQAWLDQADAASVIAQQAEYSLVRSIRHKPAATTRSAVLRDRARSMDDDRWRQGYACLGHHGLHFDLQTPWWHLDEACDLARSFPETTIILNHTGLPAERDADSLRAWHAAMARFANLSNVAVKISGICQPGRPWSLADNRWIICETIAMFGVDRVMFASNFPVDGVCDPYRTIYDGFASALHGHSVEEKRRLFHDNAIKYYRPV